MDKETLSNYGWVVICVLVLVVMIALATPFGKFIATAVKNSTKGLFNASEVALNKGLSQAAGVTIANPGDIDFDTTVDGNTDNKPHATGEAFDVRKFYNTCKSLTGKITFSKEKYSGNGGI